MLALGKRRIRVYRRVIEKRRLYLWSVKIRSHLRAVDREIDSCQNLLNV